MRWTQLFNDPIVDGEPLGVVDEVEGIGGTGATPLNGTQAVEVKHHCRQALIPVVDQADDGSEAPADQDPEPALSAA